MRHIIGFAGLVAALLAHPMQAQQLSMTVRESGGQVLVGARADLWSATTLLVSRLTDDRGTVVFGSQEVQGATAILVRQIGYFPVRVGLTSSPVFAITLERTPALLPELTVSAVAQRCPQEDDPAARERWAQASMQYLTPSLQGRRSRFEQAMGVVSATGVANFERDRLVTGSREYTAGGMATARSSISRFDYAFPLNGTHQRDEFGAWGYPALYAELAGYFADELFAAHHTFRFTSDRAGALALRFCARNRRASGLDGTLRLDDAGSLVEARWIFWNPARGREEAGGEVVFAPVASDLGPLLAASGVFWRRLPSGQFFQRWQRYVAWTLTQ